MKTTRLARTAAAGLLGFVLLPCAIAQEPGPEITGQLHLKITDGKGVTKEYHLSKSTPLPMDLLPLIGLLESEEGVNEIVRFAEQSMHTWSDDLLRRLAMRSEDRKPWLGVAVQPLSAEVAAQIPQLAGAGLMVRDAAPGSPAAAAGLLPNDVLSGLNDQILFSEDQLSALIATFAPGDEVTLKWTRGAGEMTAKTTLTAANPRPPRPVLGPEAAEYIERQFGSEVLMLLEAVAFNPQIVAQLPIIEDVIQLDDDGNIRWKTEAAGEIRKHLAAHAAELLPGFDRMLLELNPDPDVENLVDQMGKELKKASPEIRKRITNLVGKMMADLMSEIEEQ